MAQNEGSRVLGWIDKIPQSPADVMFGLSAAYRADTHPNKVDLGVGAYRDDDAKPYILPAVKKAKELLSQNADLNHEYQPIAGMREYIDASQRLLLGPDSPALQEKRVASIQTLSGTGALHMGFLFLARWFPESPSKRVHTTTPAYVNHLPLLHHVGLPTGQFPYYSAATKTLDFQPMLTAIAALPQGSIILLHACAHNPTGVDPSRPQWRTLATVMKSHNHIPFFDSAYQGFASGDVDADAWAIRHFLAQRFACVLVAQSYAKNMGLYGERAGCLHVIAPDAAGAARVTSQLERLQRVEISTPPAFSARVAALILTNAGLYEEWMRDLRTMAGRIREMRRRLRERLEGIQAPGTWGHITDQQGMFCYSGLDEGQVEALRRVHHVYATPEGRFSVAGLNSRNVDYVADAIKAVMTPASKL